MYLGHKALVKLLCNNCYKKMLYFFIWKSIYLCEYTTEEHNSFTIAKVMMSSFQ